MAEEVERRETVIVEKDADTTNDRHGSNLGWLIALILLVLVAMVFLLGLSPFGGNTNPGPGGGSDINVETPQTTP